MEFLPIQVTEQQTFDTMLAESLLNDSTTKVKVVSKV